MKKVLCVILSLCCALFVFAGCNNSSSEMIYLDKCNVGDSIPVYPSSTFTYKIVRQPAEDIDIEISDIKVILKQKNEIKSGDIITGNFAPYVLTLYAKGKADKKFSNANVSISILGGASLTATNTIKEDGTITWEQDNRCVQTTIDYLIFSNCTCYYF